MEPITLTFQGRIPAKKNGKHSFRGRVVIDPETQTSVQHLTWAAKMQWTRRTPLECAEVHVTSYSPAGQNDLDGELTTLLDVLKDGGIIRDDNKTRVPAISSEWIKNAATFATVKLIPVERGKR